MKHQGWIIIESDSIFDIKKEMPVLETDCLGSNPDSSTPIIYWVCGHRHIAQPPSLSDYED